MTVSNIILAILVIAAAIVICIAAWRLVKLTWRGITYPFRKRETRAFVDGFNTGVNYAIEKIVENNA